MTVILESASKVATNNDQDSGRNETAMKTIHMEDASEVTVTENPRTNSQVIGVKNILPIDRSQERNS